ncbi:hypothetical protein WY13_02354 [Clostridium ljungdahlii]|uniref:Uncharacterized protein n=1 Tax=Clostridium ljungdahlii TaxID=1538 RepID=A0A168NVD7_9CLOT|nr:hypothetical protein WY13_02354 [Clostridium ljungdahlii]
MQRFSIYEFCFTGKEASILITTGNILEGRIDNIEFGTVCWECGADLSRDTLYIKSYEYDKAIEM